MFSKQPLSCTLIGMKILLRLCLCFTSLLASAQHLVKQEVFDAIATEYSGEAAQENTRRIVEFHRIQGSPMMAAVAEQEARFASDSEGLATKPNFALISFEAVNFMNGRRSTAEIADLLSAEYLLDIDQAWVDRLVSILDKQKLVAK
jgi:hypothetical protein